MFATRTPGLLRCAFEANRSPPRPRDPEMGISEVAHNALPPRIIERRIRKTKNKPRDHRKSYREIRYSVVGLGHLAQVAVATRRFLC